MFGLPLAWLVKGSYLVALSRLLGSCVLAIDLEIFKSLIFVATLTQILSHCLGFLPPLRDKKSPKIRLLIAISARARPLL